MTDLFELKAETRKDSGKASARRLRRIEDRVPAIVYGADKEAHSISLSHNDILHAFANPAVYSHILKLQIDSKASEQVVLKSILRHTHKPKIMHIDFLRVKAKEKITMQVPIHLIGEEESPGIKDHGGVLTKSMTEVEIRCLPANLPEFIELDMSKMELEQTLHLSDLKLPSGVELTILELDEEHDHPIVRVHVPKVTKEDIEAEQHEAELADEAAADSASEAEAGAKPEAAEGESAEAKGEAAGGEGKKAADASASKDKKE